MGSDSEFQDIQRNLSSIDSDLEKVKEKIISLNAEYINDKTWVHNSLRSTLDTLDRVLDRLSRLEGKMDNGINKTVSELKEAVTYLNQEHRSLVSRADLSKIEEKFDAKLKDERSEARMGYGDLKDNMKESNEWRHKNTLIIFAVVGQIFTLIGVIIAIIQLT